MRGERRRGDEGDDAGVRWDARKLGEFGRDLIVLMEKIEDVHESTTSHTGANVEIGKISRLVSKALGDHHEIFGILKKDHDGQREMRRHLELCTAESKNLLVQTKEILEELRRWRQEQSEANDLRLKDEQASKPFIDDCKERLRVIDRKEEESKRSEQGHGKRRMKNPIAQGETMKKGTIGRGDAINPMTRATSWNRRQHEGTVANTSRGGEYIELQYDISTTSCTSCML
ncbi:unnamed protein product [Nippostrongylus brasiliensis]|uniref:SynN domain-containing protein n=1 Tax=Nippostrongylus brasiliensis TaxID=27835 RepID=A0A0N4XFA6_NIPBR|nr:unnamed protein product [Nippostrongylus brasiliensis]